MNDAVHSVNRWSRLESLGFRRGDDGRAFQYDGMLLRPTRRWLVFATSAKSSVDPLRDSLGKPGLWKPHTAGATREFHLPLAVLGPGGLNEAGAGVLRACTDWAMHAARGKLPDGWTSPPRDALEKSLPDGGLTVESGPLVRQGQLIRADDRLALSFPIVPAVSATLPESRRAWLERLMLDALARWRLVRVGWRGAAERPALEAEVDLSGAPHDVLEILMPIALDALRWVVEWLLWPANLLADIRVECRLWDVFRGGDTP